MKEKVKKILPCLAACLAVAVLLPTGIIDDIGDKIRQEAAPSLSYTITAKASNVNSRPIHIVQNASTSAVNTDNPADSTCTQEKLEPEQLHKLVWIGDSRSVGLKEQVNPDITVIGKSAVHYDWLCKTSGPQVKKMLDEDPDRIIIMNLGINDCISQTHGASSICDYKYMQYINKLVSEYPDTKFYILSLLPVNGDYITKSTKRFTDKKALTSKIENFNAIAKADCKATYIDGYSYLNRIGFSTVDGVHYTASSYKDIYNYAISQI